MSQLVIGYHFIKWLLKKLGLYPVLGDTRLAIGRYDVNHNPAWRFTHMHRADRFRGPSTRVTSVMLVIKCSKLLAIGLSSLTTAYRELILDEVSHSLLRPPH